MWATGSQRIVVPVADVVGKTTQVTEERIGTRCASLDGVVTVNRDLTLDFGAILSPCSVTVSVHDQPRDQCMICHMISV